MPCGENGITGFVLQDASKPNARGLEISGMHFKSLARFQSYFHCIQLFSVFLSRLLFDFSIFFFFVYTSSIQTFLSDSYYITR